VTVVKKDAVQGDANKIIKIILKYLGDDYQVEVKFISE